MSYNPVGVEPTPRHASFEEDQLQPPAGGFRDSGYNRDSYGAGSTNMSFDSAKPLGVATAPYQDDPGNDSRQQSAFLNSKEAGAGYPPSPPLDRSAATTKGNKKRTWLILGAIAALALIIIAVIIPVYFKVIKKSDSDSASAADNTGGSSGSGSTSGGAGDGLGPVSGSVLTGGDGSSVTTEDGTTFTYNNKFGGFWVQDPNDPWNNNAQAQSWSPPLNKSWDWQNDRIRGVNLGGWLVPEPFIAPALFEPYANDAEPAIDEWTLSIKLAADTANGGLAQLENHYKTFITEEDFAQIAAAGLNWIRLPIPFWAIQAYDEEPFLAKVCWKYVLKAFAWSRKYGLRINLDLHALPGSQNGYNHSGKRGMINFLMGVMGLANAERGLDYQRVIVEFINQPEYQNLVPMFGVMNEARVVNIGMDVITSFYLHMHDVLRNVTGLGEGKGPYLSIHDGFQPLSGWADFFPGNDRVALDTHPYMCFTGVDPTPLAGQILKPCKTWSKNLNASWTNFGVTTAGEWSLAINDCGLYVNGVNSGTRYEGTLSAYTGTTGDDPNGCSTWTEYENWTAETKANLEKVALASMDALQNYFFWTWKIGKSSKTGKVEAPFWSYQLGLENGWMPADPRAALGVCGGGSPASPLQPSMTGGAGSGEISDAFRAANPWPPATMHTSIGTDAGLEVAALPTYTQTGPVPTLPAPTVTAAGGAALDGWSNDQDTAAMFTPVAGCTYPPAWEAAEVAVPAACSGPARVRAVPPQARRTAAP